MGTVINRNPILSEPFEMISLESAEAPDRGDGPDWYRYVIGQGSSQIEGYREGSREAVTVAVELMVQQLNDRRMGNYGAARARRAVKKKPAP